MYIYVSERARVCVCVRMFVCWVGCHFASISSGLLNEKFNFSIVCAMKILVLLVWLLEYNRKFKHAIWLYFWWQRIRIRRRRRCCGIKEINILAGNAFFRKLIRHSFEIVRTRNLPFVAWEVVQFDIFSFFFFFIRSFLSFTSLVFFSLKFLKLLFFLSSFGQSVSAYPWTLNIHTNNNFWCSNGGKHTCTHTQRLHTCTVHTERDWKCESLNLMPISLFVCTMAFKRLPFAFHTMRLPHNILYFIVVDGFHWALKEMETTKYFSVNQSQWIIRVHIYYICPLGATISMVFTANAEPETKPRRWIEATTAIEEEEEWGEKKWIGTPNTFSHLSGFA